MVDRIGKRVKITGGMKEFVGRTGTITSREMDMYRVRLDHPVNISGVGEVRDDLWESGLLRTLREKRPIRLRLIF